MDIFEKAMLFAINKHSGQIRKGDGSPYILHPMEAAAIAATITTDKDVLCAALLHDTLEDTDTTFEELEENFGRRISLLVYSETEDKMPHLPAEETWVTRKETNLVNLEHAKDMGVKIMWMGDKLSNIRSFARLYRRMGDDMWQMFNQKDKAKHAWYYRTILNALRDLAHTDAYREFEALVNEIFSQE